MGICGQEQDDLPCFLGFFEMNNEAQKNYCLKIRENYNHEKTIRFKITSSPGIAFSIQLKIKNEIHKIQTTFDESQLNETLNKMYKLLDNAK